MKSTLILFCLLASTCFAQPASPEAEVRRALAQFLQVFDQLEWEQFTAFFADDATMFQPRKFVRRANDKSEIESEFRQIFDDIRGSQTKPPYMDLQPRDLRIQMLGDDVAIVTFHLDNHPGLLNRRTLIWQHFKTGWKIVHIHASELPIAKGE
jgi:ketosteroid isomerase-like protein